MNDELRSKGKRHITLSPSGKIVAKMKLSADLEGGII
jgi:hypothetical protein